jgi:hypothetical protein
MFGQKIPVLMLLVCIPAVGWSGSGRIAAGDPVERVYKTLGTPTLEFPLNGNLIQRYEQCNIVSRDGIVLSVEYGEAEAETAEEVTEKNKSPTVHEVMTRAENGDPEAQYLLAYSLQTGQVVEQDYKKAVEWYTRSALQGYMPAQHNLGVLYMNGEGVDQDDEKAYVWALLAARNGNDSLMNAIRHKLSREQRRAGELRVQEMLSRHKQGTGTPDSSRTESPPAP